MQPALYLFTYLIVANKRDDIIAALRLLMRSSVWTSYEGFLGRHRGHTFATKKLIQYTYYK